MSLRSRLNDRAVLIRLGMLCLILASALHWFVYPAGRLGSELTDGVMGVLFGLSIGLNLQAVRLASCGRRRDQS